MFPYFEKKMTMITTAQTSWVPMYNQVQTRVIHNIHGVNSASAWKIRKSLMIPSMGSTIGCAGADPGFSVERELIL